MSPVLGYWKTRCIAQSIRLLLEYVGEEYENKLYECGDGPEFNKDCWFKEKYSLGLDFPNLPFYIDGDLKLTQSEAILRYVANKHNIGGKTHEENGIIDMIGNEVYDFRMKFTYLCYYPTFESLKDDYLKELPKRFKSFSNYLNNNPWLTGSEIRYPDFHFYDVLVSHLQLASDCLDNFPNLKDYIERFENLERIQLYLKSDRFVKPMHNKYYSFGN